MTLDHAVRSTSPSSNLAFVQQGLEHLRGLVDERVLFLVRTGLCVLMIAGLARPWPLVGVADCPR